MDKAEEVRRVVRFIRAWQSSASVDEVVAKYPVGRETAITWASRLRGRGVPMKAMGRGRPRQSTIQELVDVARESLQ